MTIRYGPDFNPRGDRPATDIILIHCSATQNSRATPAEAIVRYHMERLGWQSCGYHVVIERDGTAVETLAPTAIGAHSRGLNGRAFGICLIGGLDDRGRPEAAYTAAQWQALERVVRAALGRWPASEVMGHRDAIARDLTSDGPKACPCFDAIPWWETVSNPPRPTDDVPDSRRLRLPEHRRPAADPELVGGYAAGGGGGALVAIEVAEGLLDRDLDITWLPPVLVALILAAAAAVLVSRLRRRRVEAP